MNLQWQWEIPNDYIALETANLDDDENIEIFALSASYYTIIDNGFF